MKTAVNERPILFSAAMVKAILEGRKTQTRRVIKPQPSADARPMPSSSEGRQSDYWSVFTGVDDVAGLKCPYGGAGDQLWVRETWRCRGGREYEYQREQKAIVYRATAELIDAVTDHHWRPSIFMPRWASRLTLEVVKIRAERLLQISEADARAEGCPFTWDGKTYDPPPPSVDRWQGYGRASFFLLWDKLNAQRGFGVEANPWVWVVEFKRLEVDRG